MRSAFFNALHARMAKDADVFLVIADMGLGLVEPFEEAYPDRFVNVGIAEANMIGVAAGLVNVGYKVVCYTCSQFYLRAFEHIRNEVGLNGAPLVLVGTTVGYDNAALGPTHHVLDDWGALKAIPNLDIYCPSSKAYAASLADRVLDAGRAAYIRIGKGEGDESALSGFAADSWRGVDYLPGKGRIAVGYGSTAHLAMSRPHHAIANRLRPLPQGLREWLPGYKTVEVIEDQFANVGLYADICQLLQGTGVKVESRAPTDFDLVVGASPETHHKRHGMDAER